MQHLHITFDFALHVTLPHHTRMMGPLYFLSIKKVQIFGVCYEGARNSIGIESHIEDRYRMKI